MTTARAGVAPCQGRLQPVTALAVCTGCDKGSGTGSDGKISAWTECEDRARKSTPKGRCWDLASMKASSCLAATDYDFCILGELSKLVPDIPTLKQEVIEFYRGACRDGGDWTNRFSATAKGTDAGVSEAGADAASDAAADGG